MSADVDGLQPATYDTVLEMEGEEEVAVEGAAEGAYEVHKSRQQVWLQRNHAKPLPDLAPDLLVHQDMNKTSDDGVMYDSH